jgi:hypothetical protein
VVISPNHDPAIAPVPGRPGWFTASTERAVFVAPPVTAPTPRSSLFPRWLQGPTSCSSWREAGGKTPRCWGSSLSERWARSLARIVRSAVRTVRVAARFLTVRAQAFKQAPEERFVSCQACCPVRAATAFRSFCGPCCAIALADALADGPAVDDALRRWSQAQLQVAAQVMPIAEHGERSQVFDMPDLATMPPTATNDWMSSAYPGFVLALPGV